MRRISHLVLPTRDQAPHAAHRLRNIVHEVLLYSHDQADLHPRQLSGASRRYGQLEESVRNALAREFFSALYIERSEVLDLVNRLATAGLVLLAGPRGVGKTTVLLSLERSLRQEFEQTHAFESARDPAGTSVHYINLKEFEAARRGADGAADHDSQPKLTVCAYVFDQLQRFFFPTIHTRANEAASGELELRKRWLEWKTLNVSTHGPLRSVLDDEVMSTDNRLAEWQQLLWSAEYKAERQEAEKYFARSDGTFRLRNFLQFLSEELDHKCILLVDNIDRYPRRLHVEVFEAAARLTGGKERLTPIVLAVRDKSLPALQNSARLDVPVQLLMLGAPTSPAHQIDGDPDRLFSAILAQRLAVLEKILDGTIALDGDELAIFRGHVMGDLETLGFLRFEDYASQHLETFRRIHSEVRDERYRADLDFLKWNNNSFRSAATQMFNMLDAATLGTDPIFPRPLGAFGSRLDPHDLRNLAWRRIVFGDRTPPGHPEVVNLFEGDESLEHTDSRLSWQRLRILQYLGKRRRDGVTYVTLTRELASAGLRADTVARHLHELARSRGLEGEGLVLIDQLPRADDSTELHADSLIEIRPAGDFFMRQLARSCEYVFWMSMYTDVPGGFWPPDDIAPEDVWDDVFRLDGATTFVEKRLMPALRNELGYVRNHRASELDRQRFKTHRSLFLDDEDVERESSVALYPGAVARSLGTFLRNANQVPRDDRAALERRLAAIEVECVDALRSLKP